MSSPLAIAEPPLTPPTKAFTAAWIAYFLFALSVFLWWPSLLGLVVCYSKRGDPDGGFIDSHHRWLIRTFWYAALANLACIGLMLVGLWPILSNVLHQVARHGDWGGETGLSIDIDWSSILSTVGGAAAGGFGFVIVWIWFVYRVVRGMLTLGDARPMP